MHVYALLPSQSVGSLRASVPTTWTLELAAAPELVVALRSKRCDVVVLDPLVIGPDSFESVVEALARGHRRLALHGD